MIIALASDHAGYGLKEEIKKFLRESGYEVDDVGCSGPERCDYPEFAHMLAEKISRGERERGIIMCGSGNGISMAANRHEGVRAALCWNPEVAALSRSHNDANVLSLPARFMGKEEAIEIAKAFLSAAFEGGRHADRVKKIEIAKQP